MTAFLLSDAALAVRHCQVERRVSWAELFFDLVFVAAVAQVGLLLARDYSAAGLARFAFMLGVIWWAWNGYAMYATRFVADDWLQRVLTSLQMVAVIFMAANADGTLDGDSTAGFAAAYQRARRSATIRTMLDKPIDAITSDDIVSLVEDQTAEGIRLDYKETLPGTNDEERKEFLADVCAFANARGGYLVYGIKERRDSNGRASGLPEAICGVAPGVLNSVRSTSSSSQAPASVKRPRFAWVMLTRKPRPSASKIRTDCRSPSGDRPLTLTLKLE